VAPLRDLPPGSIPSLIQTLDAWSAQCTATLSALEFQIEEMKSKARSEGERKNKVQKILEEKLSKADDKAKRDQSKAHDEDGELTPMDVDGGGGGRPSKSSKRSFWPSGGR
jgi:COP9 signalosome complex subunit 7